MALSEAEKQKKAEIKEAILQLAYETDDGEVLFRTDHSIIKNTAARKAVRELIQGSSNYGELIDKMEELGIFEEVDKREEKIKITKREEVYQEGFEEGYSDGHDEGKQEGYAELFALLDSGVSLSEARLIAVQKGNLEFRKISDKLKTPELCLEAVQKNRHNLQYVPKKLQTTELKSIAAQPNAGKKPLAVARVKK